MRASERQKRRRAATRHDVGILLVGRKAGLVQGYFVVPANAGTHTPCRGILALE